MIQFTHMYEFEEYKPTGGRFTPTITIGRGGFGLSVGFAKKYTSVLAGGQVGVKLFFDRAKTAVGFKFVPAQEEGALKMKTLKQGGYYVGAREFLVKYDIDRDRFDSRYHPKEENTPMGQIFVIELRRKPNS